VDKRLLIMGLGKIIFPIPIYYIAMSLLQMVLGSLFPGLLAVENTMWFLTVVNLGILPVLYFLYRKDRKDQRMWKKSKPQVDFLDVLLVMAGSVCISRGANLLIGLTPLPYFFQGYEEVMEVIYGGSFLSQIVASVISAAVIEELLMRGLLYGRLRVVTGNVKISLIASAIIFGIFHGNVVQGVYAFILGLFFAQLYEGYGKLWVPILSHMVANATSVLLEEFSWLNQQMGTLIGYYLQTAVFTLVGLLVWKSILKKCGEETICWIQ